MRFNVVLWFLLLALATSTYAAEPKRLTHDGRMKFNPSFINENEIGFVDFEKPTLTIIKRLNLKDGRVTPLHENVDKQELEPAFWGDGRHSVFHRASGTLQTSLVIRDEKENENIELPPRVRFQRVSLPGVFSGRDAHRFLVCRRGSAEPLHSESQRRQGSQAADEADSNQQLAGFFARRKTHRVWFNTRRKLRAVLHEIRRDRRCASD